MLIGIEPSRTSTRLSTSTTDKLQHQASLISSSSAHRTLLRDDSELNTDRTDGSQPLSSNTCLLDTEDRCPTTKQPIHSARQLNRASSLSLSSSHEHTTRTTPSAPPPERLTYTQQTSSNSAKPLFQGNSSEHTSTDHTCSQARASSQKDG